MPEFALNYYVKSVSCDCFIKLVLSLKKLKKKFDYVRSMKVLNTLSDFILCFW